MQQFNVPLKLVGRISGFKAGTGNFITFCHTGNHTVIQHGQAWEGMLGMVSSFASFHSGFYLPVELLIDVNPQG